jgi:hypothetical protein
MRHVLWLFRIQIGHEGDSCPRLVPLLIEPSLPIEFHRVTMFHDTVVVMAATPFDSHDICTFTISSLAEMQNLQTWSLASNIYGAETVRCMPSSIDHTAAHIHDEDTLVRASRIEFIDA